MIVGHADKSGNEQTNITLSKQRAEKLKSYLIIASDKIKKEDISIEWHGSSQPIKNLPENISIQRITAGINDSTLLSPDWCRDKHTQMKNIRLALEKEGFNY